MKPSRKTSPGTVRKRAEKIEDLLEFYFWICWGIVNGPGGIYRLPVCYYKCILRSLKIGMFWIWLVMNRYDWFKSWLWRFMIELMLQDLVIYVRYAMPYLVFVFFLRCWKLMRLKFCQLIEALKFCWLWSEDHVWLIPILRRLLWHSCVIEVIHPSKSSAWYEAMRMPEPKKGSSVLPRYEDSSIHTKKVQSCWGDSLILSRHKGSSSYLLRHKSNSVLSRYEDSSVLLKHKKYNPDEEL